MSHLQFSNYPVSENVGIAYFENRIFFLHFYQYLKPAGLELGDLMWSISIMLFHIERNYVCRKF